MKATGIVRRIDDLGRVVIPKEIRRTLRIREGDPLEIYTEKEGNIVLRKYSQMDVLEDFARSYAESLQIATGHIVIISDREKILTVVGYSKKEMQDKLISSELEELLQDRNIYEAGDGKENKAIKIIVDEVDKAKFMAQVIVPIICEGDAIGAVIFLGKEDTKSLGEIELKLAQTAAAFLGKQIGQ